MPFLSQTDVGLSCHCLVLGTPLSVLLFLITALGNAATNRRPRLRWKTTPLPLRKPRDGLTPREIKSSVKTFVISSLFQFKNQIITTRSSFVSKSLIKIGLIHDVSQRFQIVPKREICTSDSAIVQNFQLLIHRCVAAALQATLMRP